MSPTAAVLLLWRRANCNEERKQEEKWKEKKGEKWKSGWCLFTGGHRINTTMEVEYANCTVHRCSRWLTRGSELWNHFREKERCGLHKYGTREQAVSGKRNNSEIEWEQ